MNNYLHSGISRFAKAEGALILEQKLDIPLYPFGDDNVQSNVTFVKVFKEDSGDYVLQSISERNHASVYRYPESLLGHALFNIRTIANSKEFLQLLYKNKNNDESIDLQYIGLGGTINSANLALLTSGWLDEQEKNYACITDMKPMFSLETTASQTMSLACGLDGFVLAIDNHITLVKTKNNPEISDDIKKVVLLFVENLETAQLNTAFKALSTVLSLTNVELLDFNSDGLQVFSTVESVVSSVTQLYKQTKLTHNLDLSQVELAIGSYKSKSVAKGDKDSPTCLTFKALSMGELIEYSIHGEILCSVESRNSTHTLCISNNQYIMINASKLKIGEYLAYAEVADFYGFNNNATPHLDQIVFPLSVCREMQEKLKLPVGALLCGALPLPKDFREVVYSSCANVSTSFFEGIIVIGEKFASFETDIYEVIAYKTQSDVSLLIICHNEHLVRFLSQSNPNRNVADLLKLFDGRRVGRDQKKPYICVSSKNFNDMDFLLTQFLNPFFTKAEFVGSVTSECFKIIEALAELKVIEFQQIK